MEGMKYARFKTEEELLKYVLCSLPYDAYPKVSAIGGKRALASRRCAVVVVEYSPAVGALEPLDAVE
jgi:hypothetical protein